VAKEDYTNPAKVVDNAFVMIEPEKFDENVQKEVINIDPSALQRIYDHGVKPSEKILIFAAQKDPKTVKIMVDNGAEVTDKIREAAMESHKLNMQAEYSAGANVMKEESKKKEQVVESNIVEEMAA